MKTLSLKRTGWLLATSILLASPLAHAEKVAKGEPSMGEWKVLGSGYVARRKVPGMQASLASTNVSAESSSQSKASKNGSISQLAADGKSSSTIQVTPTATFDTLWLKTGPSGLYVASINELATGLGADAGQVRADAKTGKLSITNDGAKVSWRYDQAADAILFAAKTYNTFYTDVNAYKFAKNGSNAAPMKMSSSKITSSTGATTAYRETLKFEQEPDWYFLLSAVADEPDADYWFWDYLYGGFIDSINVPINIPNPAPAGTAQIRITLRGWTDLEPGVEHHVRAELNGVPIGSTISFDAFDEAVLVADFSQGLLNGSGNNTLTLRNSYTPGEHPGQFLDAIELDYSRLPIAQNGTLWVKNTSAGAQKISGFSSSNIMLIESPAGSATLRRNGRIEPDGSGGWAVVFDAVGGRDYLAVQTNAVMLPDIVPSNSSGLASNENRADYLIIAPREFSETANALAAYRSNRFNWVKIAWLDDIYAEFAAGRVDPFAIQRFMSSVANWNIAPSNVILIGKGTLDEKNRMSYNDSFMPVVMTANPWGLTASDERLLAGGGNAPYAIGRLPIIDDLEGTNYVEKLEDYELAGTGGSFAAVLVADNNDDAGDFHENSDELADKLINDLGIGTVSKLYHPSAPTVRSQLTNSATWETSFVSYDGHGSITQLGSSSENFILRGDAVLLTNSMYPIFSALTCAAGDDSYPGTRSLASALVLNPAGGAIASLAPTGLSLDSDAHRIGLAFVESLFGDSDTIGNAVRNAKSATSGTVQSFMPRMYSVVGEPGVYAQ